MAENLTQVQGFVGQSSLSLRVHKSAIFIPELKNHFKVQLVSTKARLNRKHKLYNVCNDWWRVRDLYPVISYTFSHVFVLILIMFSRNWSLTFGVLLHEDPRFLVKDYSRCSLRTVQLGKDPYWDCLVQMKSASASWFDLERPGEHVIQSLDIEEFLWWNAVQEKRRAWQEALHHHQ